MKKPDFLILGGGTAGWMTALLLQQAFKDASITLVESSAVGTIGVGEGTTPAFKSFMDVVGIPEHEWMPVCGATYKSGIRFTDWSRAPGFESYFHPFLTQFDRDHIKALEYNALLRRAGRDAYAHPDVFCYSSYLAQGKLCPVPPYAFPFEVQYGYHFDAGLLVKHLRQVAVLRGVKCLDHRVCKVELDGAGDVTHLVTESGDKLPASFFVDCSGFGSVITEKALGIQFVSYADTLFNDRAVTLATEGEAIPSTQTTATALQNGWIWHIPQQGRTGNGYVYSSRYCTPEAAEGEFLRHLGLEGKDAEVRHIAFKTGRVETVWNRNALAVGLSQGFLEPLEATALALVQLTISRFVKYYRAGGCSGRYAYLLNKEVAEAFDGVKAYIHTHFITSDRDDTPYWRDCRTNSGAISPELRRVMEAWFGRADLAAVLNETGLSRHYKLNSWLYILTGMGIFPAPGALTGVSDTDRTRVPIADIRDFFERCTLNHMSQTDALEQLRQGRAVHSPKTKRESQAEALERLLGMDFAVSA